MDKNKTLILVVLLTIAIAVFEFAFLYDFAPGKIQIADTSESHSPWFYMALISFSLLPCFLLGYKRFSPASGFFPPVIINTVFWLLIICHLEKADIHVLSIGRQALNTFVGLTIMSGLFGMLIVFLLSKIIEDAAIKPGEEPGETNDRERPGSESDESMKSEK
jgi:hypothetical protein